MKWSNYDLYERMSIPLRLLDAMGFDTWWKRLIWIILIAPICIIFLIWSTLMIITVPIFWIIYGEEE